MKVSIYILFFSLALMGCTKETPETIIEGKVINAGSKQPVDSVLVTLQDGVSGGNSFFGSSNTTGSKMQQTTYTNAEGVFKIAIRSNTPFLSLEKKGYEFVVINGGAGQSIKGYAPGKYTNETLGIWAKAYFNGLFIGSNCLSSDTTVIGVGEGRKIPLAWIKIGIKYKGKGPHLGNDGGTGVRAFGDKYYPYWIKYQIQGIWHERVDSVYIKSFETYTDTIYY